MSFSKNIVCLDDFERMSKSLEAKSILGLILELKEQKKCKVVLLLNDSVLEGSTKTDFDSQIEKIADTVLTFQPTAEEAAEIGVAGNIPNATFVKECVARLELNNIRIIKRIERFCKIANEIFHQYDNRIQEQVIASLALGIASKYGSGRVPDLDFIKGLSMYSSVGRDKDNKEDQAKLDFLRNYGFRYTDDFDLDLLKSVENGFFDKEKLVEHAEKQRKVLEINDKGSSFTQAWEAFHQSIDDDEGEVLDALYDSVKNDYDAISPGNLNSTISLFKDLGQAERAVELVDFYAAHKNAEPGFWDLKEQFFGSQVSDPDVRRIFDQKHSEVIEVFEPREFMLQLSSKSSWNGEEVAKLAKLSSADFIELFQKESGNKLSDLINGALFFRSIGNKDEDMEIVTRNAEEALQAIASRSTLNARRLQRFGIRPAENAVQADGSNS